MAELAALRPKTCSYRTDNNGKKKKEKKKHKKVLNKTKT